MDGVEKLVQMSEVERMREIMDIISDSMHKQNDKDRMEMLAMLASTTAMETNLMSIIQYILHPHVITDEYGKMLWIVCSITFPASNSSSRL